MSAPATLRVASANINGGGSQSVAALRDWRPHLVFLQELRARGDEEAREVLQALAGTLGMEQCALGLPRGDRQQRTAILADPSVLEVLDHGPAPVPDAPYWAEAVIRVRATGTDLYVVGEHAPATNAVGQLAGAQRLATRITRRGILAVAGGDWNCYSPADALTRAELLALPLHLRPARTRREGRFRPRLVANLDVHDTLTLVGLDDPVPFLAPDRRHPPEPPGTGSHPRARIDRFYLWPFKDLLAAVLCYHQKPNPGSDHQMLMICLDLAVLAAARVPGPQP